MPDGPADNRVQLLTPPGTAAIAVMRLHGPAVNGWLARFFSKPAPTGRCVHGHLRNADGHEIDDPVVVRSGPETVDLNVHGGTWVVHTVLQLAREHGFAVTDCVVPPLPLVAIDADSELEAEMLQFLPFARTELALRTLLAQPPAWAGLAHDLAEGSVSRERLDQIQDDRGLHWLLSLPRVAIVGPANVGKSTLANQLFGQTRSVTADQPGTTRDWVGEIANLGGLAVMLIDTPGRRDTTDPIESAALIASDAPIAAADRIVLVLDGSSHLPPVAEELIEQFPNALRVANKADRLPAWDRLQLRAIETIATEPTGVDALRSALLRSFQCEQLAVHQPRWWTPRQQALLGQWAEQLTSGRTPSVPRL